MPHVTRFYISICLAGGGAGCLGFPFFTFRNNSSAHVGGWKIPDANVHTKQQKVGKILDALKNLPLCDEIQYGLC